VAGEQLVDGGQAAALGTVEDQRREARYPDDAAPVGDVDNGQVITADLFGRDLLVRPLGDGQPLP